MQLLSSPTADSHVQYRTVGIIKYIHQGIKNIFVLLSKVFLQTWYDMDAYITKNPSWHPTISIWTEVIPISTNLSSKKKNIFHNSDILFSNEFI